MHVALLGKAGIDFAATVAVRHGTVPMTAIFSCWASATDARTPTNMSTGRRQGLVKAIVMGGKLQMQELLICWHFASIDVNL